MPSKLSYGTTLPDCMDVDIVPFDPASASREEWGRHHAYRRLRHEERDPGDPFVGDANAEAFMKRPDPMAEILRLAVLEKSAPSTQIGWIEFQVFRKEAPSYEGNKHLALVEMALLKPYRRRGLGRRLLAEVAKLATDHGKSTLVGGSPEADGKGFARALGADVALEGLENRLVLEQVDWEMVGAWVAEGPERSPETTLHWYRNRVEEAILPDYCPFYTEVFNQQPFGSMDLKEIVFTPEEFRDREARVADVGGSWITAVSTEAEGEISGMTEMFYLPDRKHLINQGLTGVRGRFRGRGLGKWLKAAMLLHVREEFPQVTVVSTGNATTNEAMLAINRRLGFRKHKETENFQITLEAVERYLAASSPA